MVIKIDICEECGEPIRRIGNSLSCPNGCYEDDVRNFFSEDEMEAGLTGGYQFPPDEAAEDNRSYGRKYNPCEGCGGEDCCCCSYGRGY